MSEACSLRSLLPLLSALVFTGLAPTQEERDPKARSRQGPKPYDEVVTKEFTTSDGLLRVHRSEDGLLYEIPAAVLGRDLLLVSQIAGTQAGFSYAGMPIGQLIYFEVSGEVDVPYNKKKSAKYRRRTKLRRSAAGGSGAAAARLRSRGARRRLRASGVGSRARGAPRARENRRSGRASARRSGAPPRDVPGRAGAGPAAGRRDRR